ncbi:hypothetical protein [Maricaulis maris]|uniref:hypothetical protein n=1 Tax=Maricaulis maris TaxID=74318 RepID=UPI003B8BB6E3
MTVTAALRAISRCLTGLAFLAVMPGVGAQPAAISSEDFQTRLEDYRDLFIAIDQVTELDRTHFETGGEPANAGDLVTDARDMLDRLRDQLRAGRIRAAR